MTKKILSRSISTIVLLTTSQLAAAAQLEVVVVTAQKIEEGLQDVPIAVQTFSADQVENLTAQDIGDLGLYMPNVDTSRSPNQPVFKIRGIGTSDFGIGADPSVGVYLDGVYIGRSGGSRSAFSDLARVEVLNGPQGTLFGRNAAAGAIQYVTNKPVEEQSGWGKVTVGDYDRLQVEGVYNLPLTDTLFWRTSALYNERDGFIDNTVTGEDLMEQNNWAISTAFRWLPTEELDVIWRLEYDEIDQDSRPASSAVFGPREGQDFDNTATRAAHDETRELFGTSLHLTYDLPFATFTSITSYREYQTENPENKDGANDILYQFDDFNAEDNKQWSQEFRLQGESHDRFRWTVGFNYSEETAKQRSGIILSPQAVDKLITESEVGIPYSSVEPGFGYDIAWQVAFPDLDRIYTSGEEALLGADYTEFIDVQGDYEAWAVFGDVSWAVTDTLEITAGIRYTEDTKEFSRFVEYNDFGVWFAFPQTDVDAQGNWDPENGTLGTTRQKADWDDTTPRIVVEWQALEDTMLYASWAEGYKAGGFNSVGDTHNDPAFDPESVENYEVGIKSTWLDNSLRVNAAYFSYEYANLQELVFIAAECLPNASTGSNQFEVSDIEGDGVELTVAWAATDGLELWGNAGTLDAKYSDRQRRRAVDGQCDIVDESGEKFGDSPEISYSLGANYTFNLSNGAETSASVSWAWQEGEKDRRSCKYVEDLGDLSAIYELDTVDGELVISRPSAVGTLTESPIDSCPDFDDQEQLNARLSYLDATGSWEAGLWITNATDFVRDDKDPGGLGGDLRSSITDGSPAWDRRDPPRMWGVDFRYNF
ncbi:MAG: iron complex outermembrane receptor protein [Halioglobus sp.]|jgi:iron complex outermembrane receptor protein